MSSQLYRSRHLDIIEFYCRVKSCRSAFADTHSPEFRTHPFTAIAITVDIHCIGAPPPAIISFASLFLHLLYTLPLPAASPPPLSLPSFSLSFSRSHLKGPSACAASYSITSGSLGRRPDLYLGCPSLGHIGRRSFRPAPGGLGGGIGPGDVVMNLSIARFHRWRQMTVAANVAEQHRTNRLWSTRLAGE